MSASDDDQRTAQFAAGPVVTPAQGDALFFGPYLDPDGQDPAWSLAYAHTREHVNGGKEWFAKQVRGTAPEPPPDGFMVPPGFAEDLRNAVMDAYGLPRDLFTRPLPPPTWRTRLRSRWSDLREQTARRAFKVIAGYEVREEDDW